MTSSPETLYSPSKTFLSQNYVSARLCSSAEIDLFSTNGHVGTLYEHVGVDQSGFINVLAVCVVLNARRSDDC